MSVTLEVSHTEMSWLKFPAIPNIKSSLVTLEVSHDEMSELNTLARVNLRPGEMRRSTR